MTVNSLTPINIPTAAGNTTTLVVNTGLGTYAVNVTGTTGGTTGPESVTVNGSQTPVADTLNVTTGSAGNSSETPGATNDAGTITTPDGTSTPSSSDRFTYVPPPAVTQVSPATGLTSGGTTVTITGTNLANASFVFFGTNPVPRSSFVSNSATQIVLKSPANPTIGPVDVTVTTAGGTSDTLRSA